VVDAALKRRSSTVMEGAVNGERAAITAAALVEEPGFSRAAERANEDGALAPERRNSA